VGCDKTELHTNSLFGDFTGKVYVRFKHQSCGRPSCPTCYKSWAAKEARRIDCRLKEESKILAGMGRNGVIEHFVYSPSSEFAGLTLEKLREKAYRDLRARGVIGGVLIGHCFKYRSFREFQALNTNDASLGWYWSPHWHVLGFLDGGYDRCRNCKDFQHYGEDRVRGRRSHTVYNRSGGRRCEGCSGFEGRTRARFEVDHSICKVEGARKTIWGSAFYQLNHCTIKSNAAQVRPAVWFGVCAATKLKVTVPKHVDRCPLCQSELVALRYFGKMKLQTDMSAWDFHRHLFLDMNEGQEKVWIKDDDG
jgi:hypothetical protein